MCKEEGIIIELKFQDLPQHHRTFGSSLRMRVRTTQTSSRPSIRRTPKGAWASCHCSRSSVGCSLAATRLAPGAIGVL